MNLYFIFAYGPKGEFHPMRLISELSWEAVSERYLNNYLKSLRKEITTWMLVDERSVDSVKYEELSLLDEVAFIDEKGRVGDVTDFRREFIIRKLAGF